MQRIFSRRNGYTLNAVTREYSDELCKRYVFIFSPFFCIIFNKEKGKGILLASPVSPGKFFKRGGLPPQQWCILPARLTWK